MKKEILFLVIVLSIMVLSSCNKEEAEVSTEEDLVVAEVFTEHDLVEPVEKMGQVPEGYFLRENAYHNIEFFEDKIYANYQWTNPKDENDWSNGLWCFSPYGEGKLIAQGKGLDFRVSRESDFIAIEIEQDIYFYNNEGDLIQKFLNQDIDTEEYTGIHLEGWNDEGDTFWCSLKEAYDTKAYVAIDTQKWEVLKYNNRHFSSEEYVLNTNTGWIVYSDYPVTLDISAADKFYDSKQVITLSLYNLITKEEIDIDSYVTNSYKPKWTSDNEVLYYIGDRVNFYKLDER